MVWLDPSAMQQALHHWSELIMDPRTLLYFARIKPLMGWSISGSLLGVLRLRQLYFAAIYGVVLAGFFAALGWWNGV